MSVKPSPPFPSPASTLVLLRDRPGGGVEVLLIQRHAGSRFAAGDHVFPGGRVEPEDAPPDAAAWCGGLDEAAAAARLGLSGPESALGYWVAAVREAFEEVGVLLAHDAKGRLVDGAPPSMSRWRAACRGDHRAFWTMLREERLTVAAGLLRYFAHWITPEERPIRFDTRFFAAPMPPGQEAEADGAEIVGVRWFGPADALAARQRGEITMRVPTQRNLAVFDGAASVSEALARVGDAAVRTIRPRLITENGTTRSLLPGDPGWY